MADLDLTPREAALRPLLTDEFLATLAEAARTVGWLIDHVETVNFVQHLHALAGKPGPSRDELEPYDD